MDSATSIAITVLTCVIWIGALLHAIRRGMQDKWVGSRVAGLVVAIVFAPLYWILLMFGAFQPAATPVSR